MISTRDHGLHRPQVSETFEEVEIQAHRILRRIRRIKDIPAEQQRFNVLSPQRLDQPVQKGGMLRQAVTLDESCAEMPVRGMKDAHAVA